MPLIYKDLELSRNDLTISLINAQGLPVTADYVNYSIKSNLGVYVASNLPAIYQEVGKYYAPWNSAYPNGAYVVEWSVYINGSVRVFSENIFLLDKYAYPCSPSSPLGIPVNSIPPEGSKTFLSGSALGPKDLKIVFRDAVTGLLKNPYSLYYSILKCNGCAEVEKTEATQFGTGQFYVNRTLKGKTGNYAVKWEYQTVINEPVNVKYDYFSLICPRNLESYECKCD